MSSFGNTQRLTYNTTNFPITINEAKSRSKWFKLSPTDTTLDSDIQNFFIPKAVDQFEKASGFLIQDQTYKATIPSLQSPIYKNFEAELIHLNVRTVQDVLYHPCDWNGNDTKTILDTENYIFLEEAGNTPKILQLKACYLSFYEVCNNIQTTYVGGYEDNDFTNLPSDIKQCIIMYVADIIDIEKEICNCQGQHDGWITQIVNRYSRKTSLM